MCLKQWNWHGFRVVLTDGTTFLMPDTLDNQKTFPQQSNQKPGLGFPIARMVALISLSVGTVLNFRLAPYQGKGTGESSLFAQLIESLNPGDLLLADRYYCTFAIVALLQTLGIPVLMQNHLQRKTDFRKGKRLGSKDHLIEWQKPQRKPIWLSQEAYDALPGQITVREFSVKGMIYITTLTDSKQYHKQDLVTLYKKRWTVELDLRSLKTHMGMEMLRCKTADMVKKEIAVNLLAYNLIRGNMAQAAVVNNKQSRQLSFRATVQSVCKAALCFACLDDNSLQNVLYSILNAIASVTIGKQQRKNQPRAIKRRPKAYPLLTVPRNVACATL